VCVFFGACIFFGCNSMEVVNSNFCVFNLSFWCNYGSYELQLFFNAIRTSFFWVSFLV